MIISHRTAAGIAAAASATATACAGIVGQSATFEWTSSGTPIDSRTFIVSSLLPEYYYSRSYAPNAWAAFSVDVNESAVTFTADFGGVAAAYFPPGNRFRVTLAPTASIAGAWIASSAGITNLAHGDVTFSGNVLTIDASNVSFGAPGGAFSIGFSSAAPGPSALAAIAFATLLSSRSRRK